MPHSYQRIKTHSMIKTYARKSLREDKTNTTSMNLRKQNIDYAVTKRMIVDLLGLLYMDDDV